MKVLLSLLLSVCLTVPVLAGNIHVKIDTASGDYTVTSDILNWTFGGSIGQPLHHLQSLHGKDAIGMYDEYRFSWQRDIHYQSSIRWYAQTPVVIFSWSLPNGTQQAPATFPVFTTIPRLPYRFSYHNRIFPLPQFILEQTSTPWMLFNDSADACVLSPASDFIVSLMSGSDSSAIACGLNPEVTRLPAHFTHSTIMVLDKGIRTAWDKWGNALRAMYKRTRPANDCDTLLKYFGYWTDNGGDYYYNYDPAKGYAGTLQAVHQYYKQHGIPLGYMQLDSWWYEKSNYNMDREPGSGRKKPAYPAGPWNLSGGLMQLKADTFLFPHGLSAFQKELGLPLATHSRWIDPNSPYHSQYKISGFAATDPAFWKHIMAYLKTSGVICYEQDWMNYMYMRNPEMISDVNVGNAFTDGMAEAARQNGIHLQYCMALPRYFMQGVKYNNLTSIRTAGDRFKPERWIPFLFTSQLAYEMGIWPWSDVFKSPETGNMIVSVLSAGVVGTGDSIGAEDKHNIMMACRTDGVLVKPDLPLLPMDENYVHMARSEKTPILSYTYTRHGDITTGYIFAFANDSSYDRRFSFQPAKLGWNKKLVVYNPQSAALRVVDKGQSFADELGRGNYACYIVAPVTAPGIAFLGDAGKIAATGKKRIAAMAASARTLKIKVLFAKGETSVVLRGYSLRPVTSDKGRIATDPGTHLFSVTLPAPAAGSDEWVTFSTP